MTNNTGRTTKDVGARLLSGPAGSSIASIFAGKAVLALLRLFSLYPARDFYQRELCEAAGERLFLIQRALAKLLQAGLITQTSRGNRVYYRANQSHPAFEDLKTVIVKTVGLGDALRTQLASVANRIPVAFVYGSVARGEESATSDVDIMLIGDLTGKELSSIITPIKKLVNREINPTLYTPVQFRKRANQRHPFVISILKEPKLFLIGDDRALKAILGRRAA